MGCFNRMGFISNIPLIEGDDTVMFICLEHNDHYLRISPIASLIPVAPPIYGKYDDYGTINNIVKDANVKIIEEYFDNDIESIIDILDDFEVRRHLDNKLGVKYFEKLANNDSVYINIKLIIEHKRVIDTLIDFNNQPLANVTDYAFTKSIGEYWLMQLGFVLSNKEEKIYNHPSCDTHYVKLQKNCLKIYSNDDVDSIESFYRDLNDFMKVWHEHTGIQLTLDEYNSNITYIDLCWDNTMKKIDLINKSYFGEHTSMLHNVLRHAAIIYDDDLNNVILNKKLLDSTSENNDELKNKILNIFNAYNYNDIKSFDDVFDVMGTVTLEVYKNIDFYKDELKKTMCDFVKLYHSMSFLSLMFQVSGIGTQEHCYDYHKKIHQEIVNICDNGLHRFD